MRYRFGSVGYLCLAISAWAYPADDDAAAAGRRVYLAEGCINCHSQYVRANTPDVVRWGPERGLADVMAQTPPLIGNRRQGPDLLNVGNRRSREWQRLHLIAPRRVTPGSRMPSYAHLFADGDERGEALLAYLGSLGVYTAPASAGWAPPADTDPIDRAAKQRLFVQWCATCHGELGRGDGQLAAQQAVRPRDLATERWHFVATGASPADERAALARIVKFGVPGTTMAGHEYLADPEVAALVAYVQDLRAAAGKPPGQP